MLERSVIMPTKKFARTNANREGWGIANALLDLIVFGVIVVDARGMVTALSEEARQMLGLGVPSNDGVPIEALPAPLQGFIREGLSSGARVAGRQIDLADEKRGVITLRVGAVPLQAGAERPGLVVVVNDVTATKRIEQNLWHYDRLADVGALSASTAHEIKNALVAGKTFVDLLLEKHEDAELVDVVRREMGRIDAIVTRTLRFVGPTPPNFVEVSLHEVVEHSLQLVQPQLTGKSIALEQSFRATPDWVRGDDRQLQQAFVNLFLNAMEAMEPNGTLTVATEAVRPGPGQARRTDPGAQAQVGVTIRDTGAGIAPEHLARLFQPFFTTKPTGTGLGLAITRHIIEEHHGQISVRSEVNRGTTFQVLLPALDTPA